MIVFSPLLDSGPMSTLNFDTIKINVRNDGSARTTLNVSLNATVETIVYDVLTTFRSRSDTSSDEDLSTDKYLLKIHGLEEYLPVNATLSELKYVHECLIENREPSLVLDELKNVNTQLNTSSR